MGNRYGVVSKAISDSDAEKIKAWGDKLPGAKGLGGGIFS